MKEDQKRMILAGGAGLVAATVAALTVRQLTKVKQPPLEVVQNVDLHKYVGEWFEIARLPMRFEKDCFKSKANYSLKDNGSIEVVNSCHKGSPQGKLTKVIGKATVDDPETNAKLKVKFWWPFKADYQIIALGDEYDYAMVGTNNRKGLWILSRTPELNITVMRELMDKAVSLGFDTTNLVFTPQEA
jgi:apolipoprotein D and lipocalin family protein